jgi:prepilin-type N-terminal cleavage/methylation domain-containing protein
MTMRFKSNQRPEGFTLVELLIAMSIFLLILLGVYGMFDTNRQTYVSGTRKVDVQQNARVALDQIAREIRMAGYFPENYLTPPASLTNAIQVGTNNALAIYGNVDGSVDGTGNGVSNIFLYCLDTTAPPPAPPVVRRGKAAADPATSKGLTPAAYTCGSGDVLAENITTLKFTYYDGNNAVTTTNRGAVRTIVITIVATESVPGPGQQPQSITLTSSVRLRNL